MVIHRIGAKITDRSRLRSASRTSLPARQPVARHDPLCLATGRRHTPGPTTSMGEPQAPRRVWCAATHVTCSYRAGSTLFWGVRRAARTRYLARTASPARTEAPVARVGLLTRAAGFASGVAIALDNGRHGSEARVALRKAGVCGGKGPAATGASPTPAEAGEGAEDDEG